jgi:hypothetical protein
VIETYEIAEMRSQGDLTAYRKAVATEARSMCAERRRAVLRHEDLALRLMEPPLKLTAPSMWTGYMPPPTHEGRTGPVSNRSPYRVQLEAIVSEAQQRDGRDYGVTGE